MKKKEFLQRFKEEKITIDTYSLELDQITDSSFVIGCVLNENIWKIFKTTERTGHYIIKEFVDEDSAFNYFYELVMIEHKRNT